MTGTHGQRDCSSSCSKEKGVTPPVMLVSPEVILDRRILTGVLTERTPEVVVLEIATAHGIAVSSGRVTIERILQAIEDTPIHSFSWSTATTLDYGYLARYLLFRSGLAKLEELHVRYEFLHEELPSLSESSLEKEIDTAEATVLYVICKRLNIATTAATTTEQMRMAIRMYFRPDYSKLTTMLLQLVVHGRPLDIINAVMASNCSSRCMAEPGKQRGSKRSSAQSLTKNLFKSAEKIRDRFMPQDNDEAVMAAANYYGVDLSYAQAPIREYLNLTLEHQWAPVDPKVRLVAQKNPILLTLSKNFNPIFSVEYYAENVLSLLLKSKGIDRDFQQGAYQQLVEDYVINNFSLGWYPEIRNQETPFYAEEVSDVHNKDIICFGTRSSSLTAMTAKELTDALRDKTILVNPVAITGAATGVADRTSGWTEGRGLQRVIPQEQIKRLITILEGTSHKELLQIVIQGLRSSKGMNDTVVEMQEYHRTASGANRSLVEKILQLLMHLGMYMRGWQGHPNSYPVESVPTATENEMDVIMARTWDSIKKLRTATAELQDRDPKAPNMLALPLFIWRKESNYWDISADVTAGNTINERLQIVERGEKTENINSCIRITSNWFVATSYRFQLMLGIIPPFKIANLRYIS